MKQPVDPVDFGLQMLQDRRRLLGHDVGISPHDRARIKRQLDLAREPWSQARSIIAGEPQLVLALDELWSQVLPFLIKGNEVSPVHHIAWVVRFMAEIGGAELSRNERKLGILAALLHDIGIGDCALPKISEASIQRAAPEEKKWLRRDGIISRLEHMELGVRISRSLLNACQAAHPELLSGGDIEVILDVIGSHDFSKIPLMEEAVNRRWLLRPGRDDWLKQCHWEADALWMLTPAGIQVDLEREGEENTLANRRAKLDFNLGLQRQIVNLYDAACPIDEFQQYGFREGMLYRSATGYNLARQLMVQDP